MFRLVTCDEQGIRELVAGSMQGLRSCDRCGDDLEIHDSLVLVLDLSADAGRAYEVVGCDRAPRSWRMWALRPERVIEGREFRAFGDERTIRGGWRGSGVAVEVTLTEDPQGMYWGWIDCDPQRGHAGAPMMIQPHEGMFRIQEPGGFHGRVSEGRGEVVRLSAKAA